MTLERPEEAARKECGICNQEYQPLGQPVDQNVQPLFELPALTLCSLNKPSAREATQGAGANALGLENLFPPLVLPSFRVDPVALGTFHFAQRLLAELELAGLDQSGLSAVLTEVPGLQANDQVYHFILLNLEVGGEFQVGFAYAPSKLVWFLEGMEQKESQSALLELVCGCQVKGTLMPFCYFQSRIHVAPKTVQNSKSTLIVFIFIMFLKKNSVYFEYYRFSLYKKKTILYVFQTYGYIRLFYRIICRHFHM